MIQTFFYSLLLAVLILPTPSLAQTSAGVNTGATVAAPGVTASVAIDAKLVASKEKASKEIDRRVAALSDINTRVQGMQKVTDAFKQNLGAAIQTQSSALTALKAKINAGADAEVIKADIKSISQAYSVFGLFMQQARIAAMADREVVVASMMATLGAKLQARLTAAQAAGADVTALATALTDLGAKISNANTQAQAAVSATAVLTADGSDKAKMAANAAALKTARTNLDIAHKDLQAAQKNIQTIILGLKKINVSAAATTTTSVTP